jgi:hypothetical protein
MTYLSEIAVTHDDVVDKAVIYDQVIFAPDEADCLYCGADCRVPEAQRRHAEDCPFTSGMWPISGRGGLEEQEGATRTFMCDECNEEHTARYACPRCERYFDDEDCFRVVDSETQLLITYAVAPREGIGICVDCAKKQADALRKLLR